MYEWTRTFHPDASAENGVCSERNVLWLVACGEQRQGNWSERASAVDVHYFKGLLEELQVALDISLELTVSEHALSSLLHPYRQAVIRETTTEYLCWGAWRGSTLRSALL